MVGKWFILVANAKPTVSVLLIALLYVAGFYVNGKMVGRFDIDGNTDSTIEFHSDHLNLPLSNSANYYLRAHILLRMYGEFGKSSDFL